MENQVKTDAAVGEDAVIQSTDNVVAENVIAPDSVDSVAAENVQTEMFTAPKQCKNCGNTLNPGDAFCLYCGQKYEAVRVCKKCGTILEDGQNFCAKCGSMYNAEKKNINKAAIIIPVVVLVVIFIICGVVFGIYHGAGEKAQAVISAIQYGEFDKAKANYKKINFIEKHIVRDEISENFINIVKENPFNTTSKASELYDITDMERIKAYKEIAQMLEISEDDPSNVMKYINKVLSIEEQYGDICVLYECVALTLSETTSGTENIQAARRAINNSSYSAKFALSLAKSYLTDAYDDYSSAYKIIKEHAGDDKKANEYLKNVGILRDWAYDLANYSDSDENVSDALEASNRLLEQVSDAMNDIAEIQDDLPEILIDSDISAKKAEIVSLV